MYPPPKNYVKNVSMKDKERLLALARSLKNYRSNLIYVDYKQAEIDCEVLAANILETYNQKQLESFVFKPIPRGGFIIMGMLSYMLDLKPSQFIQSNPKKPVMIVDDCAYSGHRLFEMINNTDSSQITIAHLYSTPELRKALIEKEARVEHCFVAHDLKDRAKENHPDPQDYKEWKDRIANLLDKKRYWIGQPDLVGFAWSEPDYPFWNTATDRFEDGWRSLPPHKCLKNKINLGIKSNQHKTLEIQIPLTMVIGIFDDLIWLYESKTDELFALDGTAAEIWRVLVAFGNIESVVEHFKSRYDVDESLLRRDIQEFVDNLFSKKLLERIPKTQCGE